MSTLNAAFESKYLCVFLIIMLLNSIPSNSHTYTRIYIFNICHKWLMTSKKDRRTDEY